MGTVLRARAARLFSAVHGDVYRHLLHLPLLSYSLFGAKQVRVKAGAQDGFTPVILVHGLGGSRGDFVPMEMYLRYHGRRRTYRIGLNNRRSLKETSAALARFVKRVARVNGSPQVDIVAHSLGGIVARLAIAEHGLDDVVRTLVTMGTPHQGTVSARYMDTKLTRALRTDSPVIRSLNEAGWPIKVKGVTFWSSNDLLILPAETAAMAGTLQIDMSPFTHFSYLIDPRSWAAVREALG